MYLIKIDNALVHGKGNRIVIDPILTLSDNSAGNLTFKINTDQKSYESVKELKPVVSVENDKGVLWRGRIVDGADDWYNMRTVNAEGVLTYLNDSVLRPFDVDDPLLFPAWFSRIIEEHNKQVDDYKKFKVGKVTIETKETEDDWDREITDYQTTMSVLDGFLNKYGGHIVVRYEADGNYIDYLNEYSGSEFENSQPISFGKNLINIDKSYKAGGVVTRLIPLGENGLTIEDVNNGKDFIDDIEAQGKYGIVTQTHSFEGIDEDDKLLTEARAYLEKVNKPLVTIEAKAIDLSIVDKDLETFKIGDQAKVISIPHSIDGYLQLNSIRLDMTNPDKSEFVFGNPIESLSKKIASLSKKRQFYTWTAYADDENGSGISLSPLNKAYLGIAENQPAKEVSIKNPKVFKWAKIKGDNGSPGQKGDKGDPGEPGEISQEDLNKIEEAKNKAETAITESQQANSTADEAQKKAKKVEAEQKKSVRNKIISEAGTYHGRIGITKKQFTFLPAWYGIFTSTTGGGAFESCPHTVRLSYVSDGVKKSFVSEKKMWATPASMSLIGNEYDSKAAAEAAVRNFKANNIPPHSKWTMDDVALFVNRSDSRYIIQEYPRLLSYPGRVGKDYEIYCIVNKTDQGNYRIEIASYYQNDKPGDKDNYVLSKSSTQKLIIEYDMEITKVAKATEFGETTTATTKDVTVFGSYNDETSDDDATVFGNGTEESPQTAVSVKKNGDMVVKGATYAQDFKIGEEFLSFRDITYKVKKMDDEQSKPLLVTEAFDSDFMSFTAGTIGTRGAQKKISITKDGYNPILVTIFYIASSTSCHPLVFFNEDRDSVYVNLYRATKSSYGSENPVSFLVTYMRKKQL